MRWMSRFTEFMRTAASRGASGWDRVMDGLGLVHVHGQQTSTQYQGNPFTGGSRVEHLNFSPPEEIPGQHAGVHRPPTSWTATTTAPAQPLFDASQVAQLRQAHREHPLIYGQSSEVGSDRSSRLQAEVQRQLEEYTAKYQEDLRSLQEEVQRLRSEKREWEGRGNARDVQAGHVPTVQPSAPSLLQGNPRGPQGSLHLTADGPTVPPSAPGQLQGNPGGPQGSLHLTADGPTVLPSAPGQLPGNPGGPQGSLHLTADGPTVLPSAPGQLPGNPGGPQGSLHLTADGPTVPPSAPGQLQGNPGGPQGSLHLTADGQSEGPPGPRNQDSGGTSAIPQAYSAGPMPTVCRSHDGPSNSGEAAPRTPLLPEGSGGHQAHGQNPSQWLGNGSAADPMALLAGGMAQLQAVVLSQMKEKSKDKDEDRSPETVKPGNTVLPQLPEVDPLTSSVDIMDWLEVITTTMQDLSDGSAEWWSRVRTLAGEAYSKWTSASPVEKLSIPPPREDALESGKSSRVNSRAASMVLVAVPDSVKQELVQRRSTGSVTSLPFRLLTIYQPGGQQEKITLLQGLQQPKSEQTAADAVKSLRAWARWLRRCRELEVAAPDPSLLTRGLTLITRAVLEKEPEVSFRTSLIRSHLLVDTKPSYDTVEKYYHHLLAECEAIAVASSTMTSATTSSTTSATNPKPEPKIRPIKPERIPNVPPVPATSNPSAPSRSSSQSTTKSEAETERTLEEKAKVPCKFFGKTFKGCARAGKCPISSLVGGTGTNWSVFSVWRKESLRQGVSEQEAGDEHRRPIYGNFTSQGFRTKAVYFLDYHQYNVQQECPD